MENNRRKKLLDSAIKIGMYLIIFYILFLLGRALWVNYNLKKSIDKLNQQIASLEQDKKNLENLNLYYNSDSFKELEARKKLGLKAPGEKVMIVQTSPTPENFPEEISQEQKAVTPSSQNKEEANWLLWWQFFTK